MSDDVRPPDAGVVLGSVRLTENDLEVPIVQLSPILRARWIIAGVMALGVVVGAAALLVGARSDGRLAGSPLNTVAPLVFVAALVATLFIAPRRIARKLLRALAASGDGEVSFRFDDEGVTIRAAGSTTTFAYRTLVKTIEGTTAFMLYVNPLIANIIPKRAFSADGVDRVRAYLAAHQPPRPAGAAGRKVLLIWIVLILAFWGTWLLLNTKRS
jgi:hypothetical protein